MRDDRGVIVRPMMIRSSTILLAATLVLPAIGLLTFGPRGRATVPTDRVIVRYWEKWAGIEAVPVRRIVDDFNDTVGARHGIWVEYNSISDVDKRTLLATAGGDPPDIAGLFDHIVAQLADQNALLPLDSLAAEFDIRSDAFKPVWWQTGVFNDRLYALPSSPFTIALYYNRRLFREAGLDPDSPPRTIAELTDAIRRLTRYDEHGAITQAGFTVSPSMLGWWPWAWPFFFDARPWDGRRFLVESPQIIDALNWVRDWRSTVGLNPMLAFEGSFQTIEGAQNPFLGERLAMVFQGPWMTNWIQTYAPHLDYGVAPFPSSDAARHHTFASADVFVIPRGARRPREAMRFLQYMMQQDVLESLCKAHCKVSPFRRPQDDFFRDHPNPHIRTFDALAESPDAFSVPKSACWAQAKDITQVMLESVNRGIATPQQAAAIAQRKLDAAVDDYRVARARREGGR
ncbi:MAG: ABC transporter substrate-binding protein [Phycisphaerales bacterium]|nr:ABC transporter substrate-binding protein [Phycisphaerales bacterium]